VSLPEADPPAPDGGVCALCGSPLTVDPERCRMCGMVVGIGPESPSPFSRPALWATLGGLVAIYLVVLVLVVALH